MQWAVLSPRQHSITRKCKPLSCIWGGYKEKGCALHILFYLLLIAVMHMV